MTTEREDVSNGATAPPSTSKVRTFSRCDYHFYRSVSRHNQSIWKTSHKFINSLYRLRQMTLNTTDLPYYTINQTMLRLVETNVAIRCRWCIESRESRPLLDVLGDRLSQWQSTAFRRLTVGVLDNSEQTMGRFFASKWLQEIAQPIVTEDVQTVRDYFKDVTSAVSDALEKTQEAIVLVKEAGYLNGELLNNIWALECKVQLQQLLGEYDRYRRSFQRNIDELRIYLKSKYNQLRDGLELYRKREATLEEVSKKINFSDLQLKLLGAKIKAEKSLDQGKLLVNNIRSHINKIFYSIMSFVSGQYIRTKSAYWKKLNIQYPSIKLPKLKDVQKIMIPDEDYGMVPDGLGQEAWTKKIDNLARIRLSMEKYIMTLMDVGLANGRNYLQGYLKGIQIDEEFYR